MLTDILPQSIGDPINSAANSNLNPVNVIVNARSYADTLANNWLVKPAQAQGIAGFVFDYEGETSLQADADITDHYTEKNTFFQDHVALKPLEVTMRGFVGEIVNLAPQGVLGAIGNLQNKLTVSDAILGKYSPQATQKIKQALSQATLAVNRLDSAIGRAKNLVGLVGGSPAPSKIEQAFSKLMALRDTAQVFVLVSPWGLLASRGGPRSFVIKRLTFVAEEETKSWVDIVVGMREVRFADVVGTGIGQTAESAKANNSGRGVFQRQAQVNKGTTSGLPVSNVKVFKSFGVLDL